MGSEILEIIKIILIFFAVVAICATFEHLRRKRKK